MTEDKKEKDKTEEETKEPAEEVVKETTEVVQEAPEVSEVSVEEVRDKVEEPEISEEVIEEVVEEEEVMPLKPGEPKIDEFRVGDTVKVNYKIIEGDKTRIQPYQGIVIAIKGGGVSKTFTVRKISFDSVGVERIFPISSPNIESLKVIKRGKVRRSKLYYLRERIGKQATRIKERAPKK